MAHTELDQELTIMKIGISALQISKTYFSSTVLFFFFFLIINFIYLFISCVGSSLLRACFLQLRRAGATPHCSMRASHWGGLSCFRAQALGARASVVVARRLSSCGARAQLLRGTWDPPRPGPEPTSPCTGRQTPNHCTTREALFFFF